MSDVLQVGVIPDHPLPTSLPGDDEGFCGCLQDPSSACYVNGSRLFSRWWGTFGSPDHLQGYILFRILPCTSSQATVHWLQLVSQWAKLRLNSLTGPHHCVDFYIKIRNSLGGKKKKKENNAYDNVQCMTSIRIRAKLKKKDKNKCQMMMSSSPYRDFFLLLRQTGERAYPECDAPWARYATDSSNRTVTLLQITAPL